MLTPKKMGRDIFSFTNSTRIASNKLNHQNTGRLAAKANSDIGILKSKLEAFCKKQKEKVVFNELKYLYVWDTYPQLIEEIEEHLLELDNPSWEMLKLWKERKKMQDWSARDWFQILILPRAYPTISLVSFPNGAWLSFFWKARLEKHYNWLKKTKVSVGQLHYQDGFSKNKTCTGFMIGDKQFITSIETMSCPSSNWENRAFHPLCVNFDDGASNNNISSFRVVKTLFQTPEGKPNVTILKLAVSNEGGSSLPPALRLSTKLNESQYLMTLGYPNINCSESLKSEQLSLFGPLNGWKEKRISPGHILLNTDLASVDFFEHDCSTSLGSPGSLIVDNNQEIAGMHLELSNSISNQGVAISINYLCQIITKVACIKSNN